MGDERQGNRGTNMRRTQVAIIGGGRPAFFCPICCISTKIESVVLERQTKAHVLKRIRAGVLEPGSVSSSGTRGSESEWTARATPTTEAGSPGRTARRF